MKRIFTLCIVVFIMASLCSCSSLKDLGMPDIPKPAETPTAVDGIIETGLLPKVEELPVEQEAVQEITEDRPIISIVTTRNDTMLDPDKNDGVDNVILTFLTEKPVVMIESNSSASEKINDFFNSYDEELITGDSYGINISDYMGFDALLNSAYDNYQVHVDYQLDNRLDFCFSHTVDVARCDGKVISFVFTDYTYIGQGSGTYSKRAVSFDSQTGNLITFDRLASEEVLITAINSELEKADVDNEEDKAILSAYQDSSAASELLNAGHWCISASDLLFYDDLVSESADRSSVLELCIPFSELPESISQDFSRVDLPADGKTCVVELGVNGFSAATVIDSVAVSDNGQSYGIEINGTIADIKVSQVQYSDSDGQFYIKHVKWASNYLSDCILQIDTVIPEGVPDLMLTYTSNGNNYSYLLGTDGIDGSAALINVDDIEVLG